MRKIAVIGLGYVGLPLAVAFSKEFKVVGFDINKIRVDELNSGFDRTMELDKDNIAESLKNGIKFSTALSDIAECDFFIISVPTPVDEHKCPDLSPVIGASHSVAKVLKQGDIVVYESTVYPGVTEDICVPILETSGLKFGIDFTCGYSPERINPGDKEHTITKIKKIVSGSDENTLNIVSSVYAKIIKAGVYEASSIKVAEAAKVIENTQRDINIAFVNELAMIFNKLGIDTNEVLDAASTKWNFLNFRPGLVGGHCIGVDPYYLTHKAAELGFHPELILASRRINDNMGSYCASQVIKMMIKNGIKISGAKVAVLGITFKQNCPDIRNSRTIDLVRELSEFGCEVSICDPWASSQEVSDEYGFQLFDFDEMKIILSDETTNKNVFDVVIFSVAHDAFKGLKVSSNTLVYDIKNVYEGRACKL